MYNYSLLGTRQDFSAEWMNEFSLAYVLLPCAYIFPYVKSRVTDHHVADLPESHPDAGYHTVMSGKWYMGYKSDTIPEGRGFDRSLALLTVNPVDRESVTICRHHTLTVTKSTAREPNLSSNPTTGFYSSTFYITRLLSYLPDRRAPPITTEQPLSACPPFAAPHWPLQRPPEDRDKYKGMYDDRPGASYAHAIYLLHIYANALFATN
ncbi:hypothetical protein EHS25_005710 [Saitozyma podzolica]|uniref:Uncharacterized protein n=1 Tax=Saitozyma podzolica TaxID=1890683 RepID=A0A427XVX9_9TREE|nr:hypothetical protein EHS25_005710 [Saitozyma podzolica]